MQEKICITELEEACSIRGAINRFRKNTIPDLLKEAMDEKN